MRIIILCLAVILSASSINSTKKSIIKTKRIISLMNYKLDVLAKKIHYQETSLQKTDKKIKELNLEIKKLQQDLNNSKTILSNLNDLKNGYVEKLNEIQKEITNFISENYFNSIMNTENINDLINKTVTKEILKKYSLKIQNLLKENKTLISQTELVNKKIKNILQKQKQLQIKKIELSKLLKKQKNELALLKKQKKEYKRKLQNLINKEKALQNRLAKLKIIKKKKQTVITSNINVKKIGSVYFKPKTASYRGPKTIPPINGKIIKKFGSYIDPVYHIRIYNESITIKASKNNAKVRAIFSGRVVYIGDTYGKKIVVIKHKNNLFSIYANLDKVSPILKKGYYVKKGQIIGRVNDTLDFEVTYKDKPINPIKVINLK